MKARAKILLAVGTRPTASNFLADGEKLRSFFDVKTAGFLRHRKSIKYIDLILDPLFIQPLANLNKLFHDNKSERVNLFKFKDLINVIKTYKLDLIITDDNPIIANIGNILNIPVWDCSPLNLISATNFSKSNYYSHLFKNRKIILSKYNLNYTKKFVYSPFFKFDQIILNDEYEWVEPFYQKINSTVHLESSVLLSQSREYLKKCFKNKNCFIETNSIPSADIYFCSGENSLISNLILNKLSNIINISPRLDDLETIINSLIIRQYGLGFDLGQIELMNQISLKEIESKSKNKWSNKISDKNCPNLTQKICEVFE